jgi:hypothetical protein
MTVACIATFLDFFFDVCASTLYWPHRFFGEHRGFGAGGILIAVLVILLVIFGIRSLVGEGKS